MNQSVPGSRSLTFSLPFPTRVDDPNGCPVLIARIKPRNGDATAYSSSIRFVSMALLQFEAHPRGVALSTRRG
jgi:hypothetical protein